MWDCRLDRRDMVIAVGLTLAALTLYMCTLPPSVLDGDSGRWQYVCHVLGVPYSTGYPGLILLGKLWLLAMPAGTVAYRMSLFSAVLGSAHVGLSYVLFRKAGAGAGRWAAVIGAALFATFPTTWWWSISIKAYSLNLVFVTLCFLLLIWWSETGDERILKGFAFVYGLSLTNHSTMLLLAPAFAAFILFVDAGVLRKVRLMGALLVFFLLPLSLYLYIPLRGNALWEAHGTEPGLPWPVAVSRGLVSSEYEPTWRGFWRLVLAPADTGTLTENWNEVPERLLDVYGELALREFGWLFLFLGVAGGVRLLWRTPRKTVPYLVGFLFFPPFVVKYGHGMQAAFLLPANLMIMLGIVSAFDGLFERLGPAGVARLDILQRIPRSIAVASLIAVVAVGAWGRFDRMDRSGDYNVRDYWMRILRHPLEDEAGILAHSGVLTPLWYFQQVEGRRPDLYGLFPPDRAIIESWLDAGRALYLAGPLDGWLPKVWEHYRLTPWGILVRIAPYDAPNEADWMRPQRPRQVRFGEHLDLLGYDVTPAESGDILPVRLYWRTRGHVAVDYLVSLRLVASTGRIVSLKEDRLVSAWYPEANVPPERFILGVYELSVPVGLPAGDYSVQLVVHDPESGEELSSEEGEGPLVLGPVTVTSPDLVSSEDGDGLEHVSQAVFGGEIELVGYSVYPDGVRTGEAVTIETLWRARRAPSQDFELLLQWVDSSGAVHREERFQPVGGSHPTSTWGAGELVRDWMDLRAPGGMPEGTYAIRLGWTRADGEPLQVRQRWRPLGAVMALDNVEVKGRPHHFEPPEVANERRADFDGKIRMLGYDLDPRPVSPGERISLRLYWQALQDINSSYVVFVHVVDEEGRIVAQRDAAPGGGTLPTTGWVRGEFIEDLHTVELPRDLATAEYSVLVGLYDPSSGARLPLTESRDDFVRLTQVQVVEKGTK